jgi:preprotein translocase subunit SecB
MAEKKKAVPKSTKAEKSVKIDPQANGSAQPGFAIEKLFLKDVSVEVPNSPDIFTLNEPPEISLEIGNGGKPLGNGFFEVSIKLTVTAKISGKVAFLVELEQAGIFGVRNVPDENMEPILAITCPNILFPYAREAISDLITKAGFTTVLLSPINFEALYVQQRQQAEAKAAEEKN